MQSTYEKSTRDKYIAFFNKCKEKFIKRRRFKTMSMVLNNGFCEMTENEMMELEGGSFWDVLGNCGAIVCTVGSMALGTTPLGLAAAGTALLWGCR